MFGEGSFGIIFSALNMNNEEEVVAVKLENIDFNKRLLQVEIYALKRLQRSRYVPRYIESGTDQNYNFLVMEFLGLNLTDIKKQQPDKKFGLLIGCKIGIELINAIQSIHDLRFIHRDIKPSNFVIGRKNNNRKIYVIDFGLAKCYTDKNGEHLKSRSETGFRGTARYASIRSHNLEDLSRRDDMWSLFYVIIEFIVGQLPWHDVKDKDQIKNIKLKYTPEELVKDLPGELMSIVIHLNSLSFGDKPDYEYIRSLLYGLLVTNNSLETPFPWEQEQKRYSLPTPNGKFKLVANDNIFSNNSSYSHNSLDKVVGTSQPKLSNSQDNKTEDPKSKVGDIEIVNNHNNNTTGVNTGINTGVNPGVNKTINIKLENVKKDEKQDPDPDGNHILDGIHQLDEDVEVGGVVLKKETGSTSTNSLITQVKHDIDMNQQPPLDNNNCKCIRCIIL